ncbi:MAG: histidinol dehydrogenase [Rhodothermia bacterium]
MITVRNPKTSKWGALCARLGAEAEPEITRKVGQILADIRDGGDAELKRWTSEIDGVALDEIAVGEQEISDAVAVLDPDLKAAIQTAIRNVRIFHESHRPVEPTVETQPGVTCWRRRTPINPVGLYIPGGTAPLFSTVIMLAVPARLAGCEDIVLCSPPSTKGSVHPAILATAGLLGLKSIYRLGGAQAIAAMAYGTESVTRVHKVFGPGNAWVTAAKRLISSEETPIDLPAGPTELLILADDSADVSFVAADVIAQAEHGTDSQVVVVTWSDEIATTLPGEIDRQLTELPRRKIAATAIENSRLIVVKNVDAAVAFTNEYAPEHLSLQCRQPNMVAKSIQNAGSVFVGHMTPEALGDYASGTNHTLPTSGHARAWSGVSVDSFCKYITFQRASAEGIAALGPVVQTLAHHEQLDGHAESVRLRLEQLEEARNNEAKDP